MTDEKIKRINELSRKSRTPEGLTEQEKAEQAAIQYAIEQCGSVRKAAAALKVDPSTIVRKMHLYKEEQG